MTLTRSTQWLSAAAVAIFFACSASYALAADTTAPVVSSVTPTTVATGLTRTFSATFTEDVEMLECFIVFDGTEEIATLTSGDSMSGTISVDKALSPAGLMAVYATCTDTSGNVGTGATTTVTISSDVTRPTVGAISPTTTTTVIATTLSATVSDNVAVTGCTLYVGGVSQGAMTLSGSTASKSYTFGTTGTFSVRATCVDAAGNSRNGTSTSVVVSAADTTAPTVSAVTPTTVTTGVTSTFSATFTEDVETLECFIVFNGSEETATMTAGDTNAGTISVEYTLSPAGTASVYAYCLDTAGNVGTGATTTITISSGASSSDITAPAVGLLSPLTATVDTAVTLSATATDAVGVTSCTLTVDSNVAVSMTYADGVTSRSYTFSTAGNHLAYAACYDAAGNNSTGNTVTIAVAAASSADTTAPTVGTISPLTATVDTAITLTTSATDAVGIEVCTLTVGTATPVSMTYANGATSYSYTFTTAGSYSAYATCTDAAGNGGTGTAATIVVSSASAADTTAPTVGTVAASGTVTEDVIANFSATYSDAVGVSSCNLYLDGALSGSMALASGTATGSGTFTSSGDHTAYVTCTDAAVNTGTGATATIKAASASSDTTAPTISTITPITATQNTAVTFSATITDATGVLSCQLYVNGSDQGAMTASSSTYSRSYTPASSGSLTAYASCGDTVGNLGAGTSVTITVAEAAATTTDTTAPTVGALAPSTATEDTAVTLYASVDDSGGMGSCVLYVNGVNQGTMTLSGGYATYLYTFSSSGSAVANAYCTDAASNSTRGDSTTITIAAVTMTEEESESSAIPGSLLKLPCTSDAGVNDACRAVYYYDTDDEERHAFPNEGVFYSWYANFDSVVIVTADFMASLTLGSNVTYRPGSTMVKFITVNTVYAVDEDGELCAIDSEATAAAIFGSTWNQQIHDIADTFYRNYEFGSDIDDADDYDPEEVYDSVNTIDDIL